MSTNPNTAGRFLGGSIFLISGCFGLPILLLDQLGRVLGGAGLPIA